MTKRAFDRFALVVGIGALITGVVGRMYWVGSSLMFTIGLIAIFAIGILGFVIGTINLIRDLLPRSEEAAEREVLLDNTAWQAFVPMIVAAILTVGFFILFNWYTNLNNPVASQLAALFGVIGAVVAILAGRVTRWDLVVIPFAVIVFLIMFGDRLPLNSPTMSAGEMVVWLTIAILILAIAINMPQLIRGRRAVTSAEPV